MAIVPTRVRKPRDKAKAEAGVLLVQRWILAVLRNEIFFSLASLNREIARLLKLLNERPFKKRTGSRYFRRSAINKEYLFLEVNRLAVVRTLSFQLVSSSWSLTRERLPQYPC